MNKILLACLALAALPLIGCGNSPKGYSRPVARIDNTPEIKGKIGRLELEIKTLQKQVNTQTNIYDLSKNQLADRENQYRKQMHLWKGITFFLMGLCVVFFFAPSPRTKWAVLLMVGTLVTTMSLMGLWLFKA